jgi:MFS family permease
VHQTANYTGVILGSLLAGWIADQYGWRWAYAIFGGAGLFWAGVLWLRLRGAPRDARPARDQSSHHAHIAEAFLIVVRQPLLIAQVIGFGGLVFVLTGYMTWMPTMLLERFQLSLAEAGFYAVVFHHLAAAVGLSSSIATDRLIGQYPRVRLYFMAGALMLCAPFVWLAATSMQAIVVYAALAGFGLFRGVYDANLFAAMFDLVEDSKRASVAGVVIAIAFVTGAFSPLIMGMMKARFGLAGGLQLTAAAAFVVGVIFMAIVLAQRFSATGNKALVR